MQVRKYFTVGEEIFNAIVHGVGALLAIAGLILAVIKAKTGLEITSVAFFMSASILLYTMSTLYHSLPIGKAKNVFERFDHLAIYLLIAGSYTPFCLLTIGGKRGLILFIVQWSLAIIGVVLKSIWINRFVVIHVLIFLGMGWSITTMFGPLMELSTGGILLLLFGGISYSIGTLFYVFSWFKFHHAVWHFFVLFGTICHFFVVYFYVL
jgi:hemolysin III